MMDKNRNSLTIGYVEYIDLPDWGIKRLRAKVDTGARTSALHVSDIEEIPGNRLRFNIVRDRNKKRKMLACEAPIARLSKVRSSNGLVETRYVVHTTLVISHVRKKIEVSLTSRGRMIHRMLLGRQSLGDDFLIDAGKRFLASKKTVKKKVEGKKTSIRKT